MTVKSRFSPSPTGLMHLGNLRTALFNVLLAMSHAAQQETATFLLRIEDSDLARSEEDFITLLMQDLEWLDLHWQEGPKHEGHYGPYFQSKRVPIYEQYYQQLRDNNQAYWCYCTDAELTVARKSQLNAGLPPRYSQTCRHLSQAQVEAKQAKGIIPALRFKIPDGETIQFEDFIQGPKSFQTDDIGDFIIKKADGSASFMFCNAVDDSLMQVTHAMRGEDHLTNTPRQLLILKALGLSAPQYGHMPLILGYDGKPLSKRNGSQSVESLRQEGYFPLAILNYLSRLGHHFENEAFLSLAELGSHFSVAHIGRSPARFDKVQLNHWQKEAVMTKTETELWQWIAPFVKEWVTVDNAVLFTQTIKQNIVLPSDAAQWAQQLLSTQKSEFVLDEDSAQNLQVAGPQTLKAIQQAIISAGEDYQAVVAHITQATGLKGKALFLPLRATVTGRCFGPELVKIFALMGKEKLLQRVTEVIEIMETQHKKATQVN